MKRLIILTDEDSEFLISKAKFTNFTSMDVEKIKAYFVAREFVVDIYKFSELDLSADYKGVYVLYQTSEAPGTFYKRFIEDLVFFLEKQGAVMLPSHKWLKAHHDKIFMELMRSNFSDSSLKTIKSWCYGSWVDAQNYNSGFPVVIKQASSSGGAGVSLATDKNDFARKVRRAGKTVIADSLLNLFIDSLKKTIKKIIVFFSPEKANYLKYDITPLSTSLIVQSFVPGLNGDYKVLFFGGKFYMLYRKNRENDFRASGSGKFFHVPENDHLGLLNFARRITHEINFPIIGMDIGFDGNVYHLLEFQMIHIGTSALHRSYYWHEFQDGKWVKFDGKSDLEEEFSRAIHSFIFSNNKN